ncbi:glycerol-3-phosphate dehydrogenase/oxidase [Microbacterium sp.]|uniref:glycerol-3-phosphate dehydrogenase/oxidase n=1 Tax=Microbacterium sp. TaxID=51671 RepID=UPI002621CCF3|nr:glycerol-3-phosphate dehydrogenase/oxidase [Microbacterium sp.]MCV0333760.1 glycerol-3-phosphate dehydrogenase/oxidase [Microbacterium sp.]MCV0375039.1 glycerol-3-phosphate dehydrogenase/oxidase [Microbacterium sp.]MCV0388441.1 glycerol-3-phosphate dehydrogenase/oxidase [Microbacterium sp.]MCV0416968.1 glycerol-3-phosphate dehydrogenase/oxidase [Microbacterium sp.]MCV0420279.1 glycerol-3-phosphate dehydrogenase/oxidase [Microbacterium sp.]
MTRESSALNVARRRIELARAADETVDVLVVGGGITGVGVALDAASRGLRVTLIEAEDLAFGTSRFSSKLVHGGLRYLATGDIATARESAHERHLLMTTIAPHLIRPLGQLLPFSRGVSLRQRTAGAVGMGLGDLLRMRAHTTRTTLPAPALVSARSATRLVPALDPHGLRGGMLSFDGQLVDDARLVATVARTAASLGARILTRVRAVVLREDGASVEETSTGERFEVRARAVINATGVWAGALDQTIHVRPSRGTHIVLAAADLGSPSAALTIPHEGSISRYVFALPQAFGRVIVGLTDEDSPGAVPRVAQPTEPEIDFLLQNLNRVIAAPLGRDRVRGAFAGLRPLVDSGTDSTADVSRRHLVTVSTAGFVTVLGGKLTTYRRMAEDAVDLAGRTRGLQSGRSRTASLRLVDRSVPASDDVLDDATGLTAAEVEFAVRTEGAMTVDDVLDRRTRVGLVDADRARCHAAVENVVARTLADLA